MALMLPADCYLFVTSTSNFCPARCGQNGGDEVHNTTADHCFDNAFTSF